MKLKKQRGKKMNKISEKTFKKYDMMAYMKEGEKDE